MPDSRRPPNHDPFLQDRGVRSELFPKDRAFIIASVWKLQIRRRHARGGLGAGQSQHGAQTVGPSYAQHGVTCKGESERESRMQLSDMDAFSTYTGRCWRSMHRAALEKKKKQKQKKITPALPVPTTAALPLHFPCPAFALSHEQVGFRANRLGCPSTSHPSSAPSAAAAKPSTIPPAPRRRWR